MKPQLLIIGYDEIVHDKYIEIFIKHVQNGALNGFSIIDLESEKSEVNNKISKLSQKPDDIFYLFNKDTTEYIDILDNFRRKYNNNIYIYIATELKYHEQYIMYCLEHDIYTLVEKPIFAPLDEKKMFDPSKLIKKYEEMLKIQEKNINDIHVTTLGRYHDLYNDIYLSNIFNQIDKTKNPVTTINMGHYAGVWNRLEEYITRDDHSYKFGYGSIMHGAYHYLDLVSQILEKNNLLFNQSTAIYVNSYGAFPVDQNIRISQEVSNFIDDYSEIDSNILRDFGETDVVSIIKQVDKVSNKTILIGTLNFSQTTPSIRNWGEFPQNYYNKNGRVSDVSIDVCLGPIYSSHIRCYDVPEKNNFEHMDAEAYILNKENPYFLNTNNIINNFSIKEISHRKSNILLIEKWILKQEKKSKLINHFPVIKLIESILSSMISQNESKYTL